MAGPVDSTKFDPSRTPFTEPAPRFTYLEHPIHGRFMVNSATKVVTPIPGQMALPPIPVKLPEELMNVPQPHVRTCGMPAESGGRPMERGCESAVNGGCPILTQFGRVGPVNLICEKHGAVNSFPCFLVYCGISEQGRPTSQGNRLIKGWRILTDRTVIPENIRDPQTKRESVRFTEVPDLAPFYDHLKNPEPEKRKRGRPRKDANREDLGAGVPTPGS